MALLLGGCLIIQCLPSLPVEAQSKKRGSSTAPPCTTLPHTADSIRRLVVAEVTSVDATHPLPSGFASLVIETFRAHFVLPRKLDLSILLPIDSHGTRAVPYLGAHAYFTIRAGKRPEKVAFGTATMHEELQAALINAIFALHGDSLPAFPNGKDRLNLELKVFTESDTTATVNALFRTTLPVYAIEAPPRRLTGSLRYPSIMLNAGKEDTVVVEFVVGADGKPVKSTMDFVRGTYRASAQEILRQLPKTKFSPMRVGGCSVGSYVKLPINFTIIR